MTCMLTFSIWDLCGFRRLLQEQFCSIIHFFKDITTTTMIKNRRTFAAVRDIVIGIMKFVQFLIAIFGHLSNQVISQSI